MTPPRSACFKPDKYDDVALIANRDREREDLAATLASFVAPGGPGEGRVLIRGDRGVGKSILTRAVLADIVSEYGPLCVIVDGGKAQHGQDAFLRNLCRDLAKEVSENTTDANLATAAEVLRRLARASKVAAKEVRQWSTTLKFGVNLKSQLLNSVQFEFGLERAKGHSAMVEESYERDIDAPFLAELLQQMLTDCHNADQFVVIFADNLDQVGYGELDEDVKRVSDLARQIFGLDHAVLVANLRTEFVSADLRKLYSVERWIKGLEPQGLLAIAKKRMELAGEKQREALVSAGFDTFTRELSQRTENAWAFLSWLAFLDYEPIDFVKGEEVAALQRSLPRFAVTRFGGLTQAEIERLCACFRENPNQTATVADLESKGVDQGLLTRAARYGALIPDLLLSPSTYALCPGLHFCRGPAAP